MTTSVTYAKDSCGCDSGLLPNSVLAILPEMGLETAVFLFFITMTTIMLTPTTLTIIAPTPPPRHPTRSLSF